MVMSMLHQITPEHRHGEALGLRLMAINAPAWPCPCCSARALIGVSALFWVVGAAVASGIRTAWFMGLTPRKPE
jgi:hypothetical protein